MSPLILVWFSLLIPTIYAATESITGVPDYDLQRPCAKRCFYYGSSSDGGADNLAGGIDCDVDPIRNDCICRVDLQPSAQSYLSSCVNDKCDDNTVDLNSALAIYNDYCTSNGYVTGSQTAATTTTTNIGMQPPSATVTVTIIQTVAAGGAPDSHVSLFSPLAAGLVALFL